MSLWDMQTTVGYNRSNARKLETAQLKIAQALDSRLQAELDIDTHGPLVDDHSDVAIVETSDALRFFNRVPAGSPITYEKAHNYKRLKKKRSEMSSDDSDGVIEEQVKRVVVEYHMLVQAAQKNAERASKQFDKLLKDREAADKSKLQIIGKNH